jgi:hypothetical protein
MSRPVAFGYISGIPCYECNTNVANHGAIIIIPNLGAIKFNCGCKRIIARVLVNNHPVSNQVTNHGSYSSDPIQNWIENQRAQQGSVVRYGCPTNINPHGWY